MQWQKPEKEKGEDCVNLVERAIEKGMELLFPSNIYCISCGSIIDQTRRYALCDHCIEKFHWVGEKTCARCGKVLQAEYRHELCYDCRLYGHDFDRGYTCTLYGTYERNLMMDYKYRGKSHIGRKLGDMLYDRMSLEEEPDMDFVVPVPIHEKKRRERGYNQAEVMAHRLAQRMQLPCLSHLLVRCRQTAPMRGLNPVQRQENLLGAFAISPKNRYNVSGKTILVVDDIYTTGSTADACSRILKQAGAGKVLVLSFAAGANVPPKQ